MPGKTSSDYDVVIVGAGFSGLYLAHRFTQLGMRALVFEAAPDVGGTWYWNTYPGARCDVESIDYSYSFSEELQEDWVWSERYAPQPEILAYINHVADRFRLREHIEFNTRVVAATFEDSQWRVDTDQEASVTAQFLVMASGGLSSPKRPDFPGLDQYRGEWFHTARWPADGVDFAGKRVAVVGTGSTGIQLIPQLARQADQVVVLQRTPNYSVPAQNRPMTSEELGEVKQDYAERRARARRSPSGVPPIAAPGAGKDLTEQQRFEVLEDGWRIGGAPAILRAFSDVMTDPAVNKTVGDFVRFKISEIVHDPNTARALTPVDYPFGSKRLCVDIDYFATYNRPNVSLIDLRERPLECVTETGVRCGGVDTEVDVIIFAIGFDAITGAVTEIDISGRDGATLRDYWKHGPKAALGMQVAGFPNLFLVNGPGSPAVLGNVVAFAEQNIEWITDCIDYVLTHGYDVVESTQDLDESWAQHVDEVGNGTLYVKAKSWYTGENVPGKPRRFLPYAGGLHVYRDKCDEIARKGYPGFTLTAIPHAAPSLARDG